MKENLIESLEIIINKQQKVIDNLKILNNIQNNIIKENKKQIKLNCLVFFLIGITFSLLFVMLYTILK
jgi:hypothetical protein